MGSTFWYTGIANTFYVSKFGGIVCQYLQETCNWDLLTSQRDIPDYYYMFNKRRQMHEVCSEGTLWQKRQILWCTVIPTLVLFHTYILCKYTCMETCTIVLGGTDANSSSNCHSWAAMFSGHLHWIFLSENFWSVKYLWLHFSFLTFCVVLEVVTIIF